MAGCARIAARNPPKPRLQEWMVLPIGEELRDVRGTVGLRSDRNVKGLFGVGGTDSKWNGGARRPPTDVGKSLLPRVVNTARVGIRAVMARYAKNRRGAESRTVEDTFHPAWSGLILGPAGCIPRSGHNESRSVDQARQRVTMSWAAATS